MEILWFIIMGMGISFILLFLGEIGLVLLGGATFGLLLYIAIKMSTKNR
ncbi:hypothetical protein ACK8P5_13410 [Paenibacillus sp. EC2-1]